MLPTEIVWPSVMVVLALVYWTATESNGNKDIPAICASNCPFCSSNAIWSPPTSKPKSASVSVRLATPSTPNWADTSLPTAMISSPTFLKPRSPLKLTKPATSAWKPSTEKATVLAVISFSKVYSAWPIASLRPDEIVVFVEVYCTNTRCADTLARLAMLAAKLPSDNSKAVSSPV